MDDFKHIRVGVGLVIFRDNQVLLQKRKGTHASGTFCCPGGHLEKWESFEDAARRETKEEAGSQLLYTKPQLWTTVNTRFKNEDKHYVVVLMVSKWGSGEPIITEPDKCESWGWYDWDSLPDPLIQGLHIVKTRQLNPIKHYYELQDKKESQFQLYPLG